MRRLKKIGIVLLVLYALFVWSAYAFQEKLIFIPTKMPQNHVYDFCQPFEEFWINTADSAKLNAVHIQNNSEKGVVLYFHGNAGNISHLGHVANLISKYGYDGIFVDYRTYGKSTGEMSEDAIKKDAQLFYDYAKERYDENKIVVYGRSFGTGVATGLAAENNPCKVILESPYYSAVELGKHRFPILPVGLLSQYRFPSHEYIQKVDCPVYVIHGTEDRIIPFEQAQNLFNKIPEGQGRFYKVEGAGHNYLQDFDAFKEGVDQALR
ncbi:alpha/beta hydrolase [Maribacter sp. 2210JD10-5]|uniref:alpha/beta hydrolase n=1 Tax=Maribacter sp. 2210JD10-5 TaxID=3386272 RepID=UPI0039BD02D5